MVKPSHIYHLNTHEVPRRAGEMKEYQLDLVVPEPLGVPLISVQIGSIVEVDARLEAVTEGILLSAEIFAVATGECIRCLDPVELEIDRKIQELYNYEPTNERGKRKKKQEESLEDLDIEDELMMEGEIMDLETPIRDAVVLSLPINPLCSEDCLGLCPECGGKWAELPSDHAHEAIDARWASLQGLSLEDPDFKI